MALAHKMHITQMRRDWDGVGRGVLKTNKTDKVNRYTLIKEKGKTFFAGVEDAANGRTMRSTTVRRVVRFIIITQYELKYGESRKIYNIWSK